MTGDWPTFTCGACGKHALGGKYWGFFKFPIDPTDFENAKASDPNFNTTEPKLLFWCAACGMYYEINLVISQVGLERRAQLMAEKMDTVRDGSAADEHHGTNSKVQ